MIIAPFYLPAFNEDEKNIIEQNKSYFYEIVQSFGMDVFDFFEELQIESYYEDATHLNFRGAEKFTGLMNNLLMDREKWV